MLLTRDQFREKVFARDKYRCVICGNEVRDGVKLDAHHIIERRLWTDGGYYLENGATLCDRGNSNGGPTGCHSDAEVTTLSVQEIRHAAGIEKVVLPEDMYPDHVYDKWGMSSSRMEKELRVLYSMILRFKRLCLTTQISMIFSSNM